MTGISELVSASLLWPLFSNAQGMTSRSSADISKDTKETPFQCSCGKGFARRDLLTRHGRQTQHGDHTLAAFDSSVHGTRQNDQPTLSAIPTQQTSGASLGPSSWTAGQHGPTDCSFDVGVGDLGASNPFVDPGTDSASIRGQIGRASADVNARLG